MRIYLSADLEGASGVTRRDDLMPPGLDYPAARRWLTADVNAAIAGARAAGATAFVVEENHGAELFCNLDLDLIDPEAEIIRGFPRNGPTTLAGLDSNIDAVMLIGHHAMAGAGRGFLAHTWLGGLTSVRVNGRLVGEGELIALAAAELGIPTILVSGDDVTAAQLSAAVPGIESAVVKTAMSFSGGRLLPPSRGARLISERAQHAVEKLSSGHRPGAQPDPPYHLTIDLGASLAGCRDAFNQLNGLTLQDNTVHATADTATEIWSIGATLASVALPILTTAR